MSRSGPVIIIDDDPDDQEMIGRIFSKMSLENPVRKFHDGEEALRYLRTTKEKPFIIICDINMPIMNGIQLKQEIDNDPQLRQGFFVKGQSYEVLKESVHKIIAYWKTCVFPNSL
jgi:CheY-like chemotaxis protein